MSEQCEGDYLAVIGRHVEMLYSAAGVLRHYGKAMGVVGMRDAAHALLVLADDLEGQVGPLQRSCGDIAYKSVQDAEAASWNMLKGTLAGISIATNDGKLATSILGPAPLTPPTDPHP